MHKAYDVILQSEVSAVLATQSGGLEPYRYECACCGEEVFVAAPYSDYMVAHFRHRSGNNDIECENYLGRYGSMSTDARSRRSNREKIEFYYQSTTKSFYAGLKYSENEINDYEQHGSMLELMASELSEPFYSISIDFTHFAPDTATMIPLQCFSNNYYIANTFNKKSRKYPFFKSGNLPAFFKIQGEDEDFKARLVRSEALFTKVKYFVVFPCQYAVLRFPTEIKVHRDCIFETMGRKFTGLAISISNKNASVNSLLNSWGYQLEDAESLTLLWPPAATINDVCNIAADAAFVYTSFDLQAHGNINVHSGDISKEDDSGISKVAVTSMTKIYQKNIEITLKQQAHQASDFAEVPFTEDVCSKFTVLDDGDYFLFDNSGVVPLGVGQVIWLTPQSVVKRYNHGYQTSKFNLSQPKTLKDESLLEDILVHYYRSEPFAMDMFSSVTISNTAAQYIKQCTASGTINAAAKQCIMEGLI